MMVKDMSRMTKEERDELDGKVIGAIQDGRRTLVSIAKACGVQGLAAISCDHPETRKIDRALQRLRKAGKIVFTNQGWELEL